MKYFTSDLHLGDNRLGINGVLNLFYRPFKSIEEQNTTILNNLKHLTEDDELYMIGDIVYNVKYLHLLEGLPKCKKHLIIGNYDELHLESLNKYFDTINETSIITIGDFKVQLNHYPTKCVEALKRDS